LEAIELIRGKGFMMKGGNASICAVIDVSFVERSNDSVHFALRLINDYKTPLI
jgi:hypothetical protein